MIDTEFYAAWPEAFDVVAEIEWTPPAPHELLFSGGLAEDHNAYFYAIVAHTSKQWWSYYIGMVFNQTASVRNRQADHRRRLADLRASHPGVNFCISLGTPVFKAGRATKEVIAAIEGLLIYGNWHDHMVNERKVNRFSSRAHIHVRNVGWNEHLTPQVAYGVFYR